MNWSIRPQRSQNYSACSPDSAFCTIMFFHLTAFNLSLSCHISIAIYCSSPNPRSKSVERGESVHLQVLVGPHWYLSGTVLVLSKTGSNAICSCSGLKYDYPPGNLALYNISCTCRTENYNIQAPEICDRSCLLDIHITYPEQTDEGTYILELDDASCTFLIANITVKETAPTCSIRMLKEDNSFLLSCEWIQRHKGEEARLNLNNRTLCSFGTKGMANSDVSMSTTVNAMATFNYIYSSDEVSSICLISQFGVTKNNIVRFYFHICIPKQIN